MNQTNPSAPAAVTATDETTPVMDIHRFPLDRLEALMRDSVPDFEGPLSIGQFQGGMSNPTFKLTDGAGRRYVLRKKPPGKLLPSAHAVDREFRAISAMRGVGIPVAEPVLLCEDDDVIGQMFYVMGFAEGRVFRDLRLPDMAAPARAAIYDAMNDTLAKLHSVDFRAAGLETFGRVGGYVERQIKRWSEQYRASKTDELATMDRLMDWLPANLPANDETTVVHGDFRLENMIFDPAEAKVIAIVDWELATLGDPLSDLAYNCLPYHMADPNRGDLMALGAATEGIPSEAEYLRAYSERTGRVPGADWTFYLVLSLFRMAAIVQGVYARALKGNAASPAALQRKERCRQLAEVACRLLDEAGA
jgi:aminoglycoside phosphotransferase (APT) family kinase protein